MSLCALLFQKDTLNKLEFEQLSTGAVIAGGEGGGGGRYLQGMRDRVG